MISALKNLFEKKPSINYKALINEGAIILDVRSKEEYEIGHVPGSINIPLDKLLHNLDKLKDKMKPIILCCASGMRSSSAKNLLQSNGYVALYNAGGWSSLQSQL